MLKTLLSKLKQLKKNQSDFLKSIMLLMLTKDKKRDSVLFISKPNLQKPRTKFSFRKNEKKILLKF
jgi:hypothetical protein